MMKREMKRLLACIVAGSMLLGTGLTGFAEESADSVPAFEDIEFPDSLPTNPTLADPSWYGYDDMSQHYDIEFFTYNYGTTIPEEDPIKDYMEEKYNVTITMTTASPGDMQTILSTRFSDNDAPDLITLPTSSSEGQAMAFTLAEQGLLMDARELYPYLPQTCKFVTNSMLTYSTMDDGMIPFFTKYAVQDGDIWGYVIRQDWLDNLGMAMPSTLDELTEYAKACTFNDPDGNGQDDTYFMIAAGGGAGLGMLGQMANWFGCAQTFNDNGVLSDPILNGSTKAYITYLNELYTAGVFHPDWFTIDWESAKSYTLKDKIGMVNYPTVLYQEYTNANGGDLNLVDNWKYLPVGSLAEGGKSAPGGNIGNMFAIPSSISEDTGKVKRILHIMDAMCYGGEDYFTTVQGGGGDVFPDYTADYRVYNEDGTSYCYVDSSHPGFTQYGTDNLGLAHWQNFGYTLKYQLEYDDGSSEERSKYVAAINDGAAAMNSYEKWPNYSLTYTVPSDTAPNLSDYTLAQEYKFITGERSMDEWDAFVQEWLDQGGRAKCEVIAEQLGCELPEVAK